MVIIEKDWKRSKLLWRRFARDLLVEGCARGKKEHVEMLVSIQLVISKILAALITV